MLLSPNARLLFFLLLSCGSPLFADTTLYPYCESYSYDSLGRIRERHIDAPGFMTDSLVYSYDGNKTMPAKISAFGASVLAEEQYFTYDNAGRLLSQVTIMRCTFEERYDSTRIPSLDPDQPSQLPTFIPVPKAKPDTFLYRCWWTPFGQLARDSGGYSKSDMRHRVFIYEDTTLIEMVYSGYGYAKRYRYLHDESGRRTAELQLDSAGKICYEQRLFEYDRKDRLVYVHTLTGGPERFGALWDVHYRYNRKGQLLWVALETRKIRRNRTKLDTYSYDKNGRLTQSCGFTQW